MNGSRIFFLVFTLSQTLILRSQSSPIVLCSPFPVTEPENKQLTVRSVIGHPGGIRSNSHSAWTRDGRIPLCHLYFLRYRYVLFIYLLILFLFSLLLNHLCMILFN